MKKRIVLLLAAAMLILSMAPISASAVITDGPTLSNLTNNAPNTGIMLPSTFSPTQESYLLTVADWVSRIYFVPYASASGVTIYFNGAVVQSGAQTPTVTLSDEPTYVTIKLVAPDAKTNTYTVYIQRRPSERRTRVSAGYIQSMVTNGSKNSIRADLVSVTYTAGTNQSTFVNETTYIYDYACADSAIFYYGTMQNPIRAATFSDFVAHYQDSGSNLYRIVYIEDEIVAVMPYAADY